MNQSTTRIASNACYVRNSPYLSNLSGPIFYAPPGVDGAMSKGRKNGGTKRYILFVGKPELRNKGFVVLFQAWKAIREEFPEIELVVAGSQDQPAYSDATFLGVVKSRKRLADLYTSAVATILPSTYTESFGMVLAEALVAGCPIIGSNIGGIPEVVEHRFNGYLVDPGSIESLATALRETIQNENVLRANIAREHSRYVKRFNWIRTVDVLEEALVQCIRNSKRTFS